MPATQEKQIKIRINKEIITWALIDLAAITIGLIEIFNPQSGFWGKFICTSIVFISSEELIKYVKLRKNTSKILTAIEKETLSQQGLDTSGQIIEGRPPKNPKS